MMVYGCWLLEFRNKSGLKVCYQAISPDFPSSPTSWSNLCRSEVNFVYFLHLTQIADSRLARTSLQNFYQPSSLPLWSAEISRKEEHF